MLPDNGRCGFLLSSYMLQTPSTVLGWNKHWSLDQRMVPRTLFPRAIRPLVFVMFTKDQERRLDGGFALYHAAAEMVSMSGHIRLLLVEGTPRKQCWRAVVEWALSRCGGRAKLEDLYAVIEPKRPTQNTWWREKVRQTLQRYFQNVDRGIWRLPEAA